MEENVPARETRTEKIRNTLSEVILYWRRPRPGEYVSYREIVLFSVGWAAMRLATNFVVGFGVNNELTSQTLGMTHIEQLVMSNIVGILGYFYIPLNAWIVDNFRIKEGKYRKYIKLAVPSMVITLVALWLPYQQIDKVSHTLMIAVLFLIGQLQSFVQNWFVTGVTNMIHVITPNTIERTRIMAISSIIYNMGPTIRSLYLPWMVNVVGGKNNNEAKYTMKYYRATFTPLTLLAPLVLLSYYSTQERLIIPKSRMSSISFPNAMRAVAGNKIFWIKSMDGWNDFLENARGDLWGWMVYRANIMSSTTYGIMNTICWNATLWAMLSSPAFIKKFGKKNIKIFKNIMQIFIVITIGTSYKSPFVVPLLFITNWIERFIDCGEVIDKAIDADMRDNQQYLIGERIDGAYGLIGSYMGAVIGFGTQFFNPWIEKKMGHDGSDYSVLNVYQNYAKYGSKYKNPDCVLYDLMDVKIVISVIGTIVDVIPWFFYDITETGQKAMVRVNRIRAVVEDRAVRMQDDAIYIEGCEALALARRYENAVVVQIPKQAVREAKALPANTEEEKNIRAAAVKKAKQAVRDAQTHNEEREIAHFVVRELTRFGTEFGQKELQLCRLIVSGGSQRFYETAGEAFALAARLPEGKTREEKMWRKQDVRNARSLFRSAKLIPKHYPDGFEECDPREYENAFNLPGDTWPERRVRKRAMRKANRKMNIYGQIAYPYLAAQRIVELYDGYRDIDSITADYDKVKAKIKAREDEENARREALANIQKTDKETRLAEKRIRRGK